jgi:hypothetical protein
MEAIQKNMFMKMRVILIFVFSIVIQSYISAQKLEFDIVWLGKIGKLYINKTIEKDTTLIETSSVVKIPFYKLSWETTLSCIDGKLTASNYQQLLNENKREFTEINQKSDNLWQIIDNHGKEETISIEHAFYVSDLYFKEPVNVGYIFSERFGKSLQIISNGNGHYTLLLPDDNLCEYFYENGICKIVKAKNGSRTIKMVRNEGS